MVLNVKNYSLNTKISFGMFKGKTIRHVLKVHPSYIDWCIREVDDFFITDKSMKSIRNKFPNFKLSSPAWKRRHEKSTAYIEGTNCCPPSVESSWVQAWSWIKRVFRGRTRKTARRPVRTRKFPEREYENEEDPTEWPKEDNLDTYCGDPDDFRFAGEKGEDARAAWNNMN
jgi:hypothetical protein